MTQSKIVGEIEVLDATFKYLLSRKVLPYQFSVPRGKGINYKADLERILEPYKKGGIQEPIISIEGADIAAISRTEWWQVECKGTGSGKKQTQRNNFDRALASVVSYYEDDPSDDRLGLPEGYKKAQPFLGLALPDSNEYLNELTRRVRRPLRQKLNLWILLYESDTELIRSISPTDEY